jgi:hypothetical protein
LTWFRAISLFSVSYSSFLRFVPIMAMGNGEFIAFLKVKGFNAEVVTLMGR